MIEINNLYVSYKEKEVLNNINYTYNKKNGIISLIGNNGVGKTTLLYSLAGIIPDFIESEFRGEVKIFGKKPFEIKRFFIFQDIDDSFIHLTVEEELEGNLELAKALGISGEIEKLSYGEKHKLAIASAINSKAELIIMDESFNGLDYPSLIKIIDLIKEVSKDRIVIFTTHNIQLAYELGEERLILEKNGLRRWKKKEFSDLLCNRRFYVKE